MADGTLTGVLDDRGKFIYITMDELESVAKFIKQRGRVSIQELAESSNRLVRLTPDTISQYLDNGCQTTSTTTSNYGQSVLVVLVLPLLVTISKLLNNITSTTTTSNYQ